jgi:hypothetical protein
MCLPYYGMSDDYAERIESAASVITWLFIVEMGLKLLGLGCKRYWADGTCLRTASRARIPSSPLRSPPLGASLAAARRFHTPRTTVRPAAAACCRRLLPPLAAAACCRRLLPPLAAAACYF